MSKVSKGYMGDVIGKLGPAVGRMWKGKNVMASYQKNVANPRTTAQQIIRARFARIGRLATAMLTALRVGMENAAKTMVITESNLFVKTNWPNVTALTPDDVSVNYSALKLTPDNAPLPEATFGAVDYGTGTHLHIECPLTGGADQPGANANDMVYLVAFCPDRNQAVLGSPSLRSADKVSVNVPASWDGMEVHVYGFALGAPVNTGMKNKTSVTTYCGNGEVA